MKGCHSTAMNNYSTYNIKLKSQEMQDIIRGSR